MLQVRGAHDGRPGQMLPPEDRRFLGRRGGALAGGRGHRKLRPVGPTGRRHRADRRAVSQRLRGPPRPTFSPRDCVPSRGEKASPKPGGDAETFTLSFRHLFGTAPSRLRTTLTAPVASPQSSTCRGTTKGQVPSLCTSARASSAKTSRRRSICMRPTVLRRHCSDRRWRMTGSGPSLGRRTMTRGARPQAHKVAGGSSFGENKRGSASRLIGERRRSVVFFLVPRQVWQELRVCLSLHQE